MPSCIIATVGQSVLTNDTTIGDALREFGKENHDLKAIRDGKHEFPGKQLYDIVMAGLQAKSREKGLLRRASAELNHLVRVWGQQPPDRNDIIHLLASDTPDGVLAARVLKDFCEGHFGRTGKIHIIEGLQVNDGELFRRQGLPNLIYTVFEALRNAPPQTYTRIISPTGGFKGVVPYLTLIGMLEKDIEISYIYEHSQDLIRLAGIPLRLDFESMEDAYEALLACQDDLLPEEELKDILGWPLNQPLAVHPLWALFDSIDVEGQLYYEPSGLGRIVLEHFKDKLKPVVFLSKAAYARYQAFDNNIKREFAEMFDRLPDPEWRRGKQHGNLNGHTIIKTGNTDERLYYFLSKEGIIVSELALHDTTGHYDRQPTRKEDYSAFHPWKGRQTS